jgi:hypothetical protein
MWSDRFAPLFFVFRLVSDTIARPINPYKTYEEV